jgi:hypothetical protein
MSAMRRFLILASLALVAVFASVAPASADYRYHRGGPRVGFGIYYAAPAPYYYGYPYYAPHYAPRTVVVNQPVYASPPPGRIVREGRDTAGNYCREYQSNSSIDGRAVPTYGTACLRPDGSWQIVN